MPTGYYTRDPVQRFWLNVNKTDGCWLWTGGTHKTSYGRFNVNYRKVLVHRFSYELHKGKIPKGLVVRHTCHNPLCVNPEHLLVGTQADNMDDCIKANRQCKGSGKSDAKINESIAKDIKSKLAKGERNIDIAEYYGISKDIVSCIKRGLNWKHV